MFESSRAWLVSGRSPPVRLAPRRVPTDTGKRRRPLVLALLALGTLCYCGHAAGQPTTEPVQEPAPSSAAAPVPDASSEDDTHARRASAQAAYAQGVAAYEDGDYSRAVVHFLRADGFMPSAAFSYNIARAYDRLGDVANSLEWYRDYLRRAPDAADREAVLALIDERQIALQEMGLQQLSIFSTPEGASIAIDGKAVGVTPWTGEIVPGTHELSLTHPDLETHTQVVYLPATEALDVVLTLDPIRRAPPQRSAPPVPAPVPREPDQSQTSLWPWLTLGAGGVALAAAGGFELARRSSEADARDASTQLDRAEAYDDMTDRQSAARVLGVVGGALVIGGGILWGLEAGKPSADASRRDTPQLSGMCTTTECGLLLRGEM